MFAIDQKVIYGVMGACVIVDIATPPINGVEGDYYYLQPVYDNKGFIYAPVNGKILMRDIMTREECDKLFDRARNCDKDPLLNEAIHPAKYDDMVKSQEPLKLMQLIRCLYNIKNERAKNLRKMKSADSRILATVRKLLYGEIAVVCGRDLDEVTEELDELLSRN